MNKTLTIFLSKIILKLLKLIGRGSSLPGEIALKLNKNLLKEFKINSKIIAVTGSSGKGSTSSMIVDSLRELGYSVAHNMKGSNLKFGIITLLIENSNIHGELNQDFLVFEMDERYAKYVFCDIEPDFVIVTNVTRDQPPRQGNVDIVLNDIKNAIPKKSHIILNADSPYMQNLVIDKENEVTYYSVCENKFSENKSIYKKLNIYYCPKCSCKLKYSYYNFEENGKYICTNEKCGFEYPRPDFEVTDINFESNIITINNKYKINTEPKLLFNVYNVIAAFSTLSLLNLKNEDISNVLSMEKLNKKIYSSYTQNSRNVYVLNNKNENATTFNQSLFFVNMNKDTQKTIVIGWWQISRRYEYNDISWLYDVDFEILKEQNIESIVCVGPEAYDIAARLKLSGIDKNLINPFTKLKDATDYIKDKTKGEVYGILNFDYVTPFNKYMKGEKA